MRLHQRAPDALRPVSFERQFTRYAEGSVLVCFGQTRVLCTASIEEGVPAFLRSKGRGWITAEYGMLPRATHSRNRREAASGKQSGRSQEIQRLIGRSLRACVDLAALGEHQITIDCDVLQADGGTRTAAISGGCVALYDALNVLVVREALPSLPVFRWVAAVSVGFVDGQVRLDLDYEEDSHCDTDLNVVMTAEGEFIELQGTAEGTPLQRGQLNTMLDLAAQGIDDLIGLQQAAVQTRLVE